MFAPYFAYYDCIYITKELLSTKYTKKVKSSALAIKKQKTIYSYNCYKFIL